MNPFRNPRSDLTLKEVELVRPDLTGMRIDADLQSGDFMVVVGRNGAGKSTLLHTMMGLLPPMAGAVLLGGDDVSSMHPRDRAARLSFVASTPPGHAGMTVRETLELGLRARTGGVDPHIVEEGMEKSGVAKWSRRPLNSLSDGMAQRVMVARAAIQGRDVMVLDEPTAFLDVVGKEEVLEQLGAMRIQGRVIVLATHDLDAVAASGWVTHWLHLHPGHEGGATFHRSGFEAESVRSALRSIGG